jgi:NTE family protein
MPRTAVVLGAGGLTGQAYEAGVLAALHDGTGFDARSADLIVGTSAGSQVGAAMRLGIAPKDLRAFIANQPLSKAGQRIFDQIGPVPEFPPKLPRPRFQIPSARFLGSAMRHPWRSRHGIFTAMLPQGAFDTEPFEELFRRFTGTEWCDAGLWIVGAKLPMCERVVFGRDDCDGSYDIPRAVSASCAIPGLMTPVKVGNELYVDGGIHSPTNADLVADGGYDHVIIVSPMSTNRSALYKRTVNPVRLYCRGVLAAEVRKVRKSGARVTVFQPGAATQKVMGMNALDQARCPDVAEIAYATTMRRCDRSARVQELEELAA